MRRFLISLVILAAISWAGFAVYSANKLPADPIAVTKQLRESGESPRYSVELDYPELVVFADEATRADANQKIARLMTEQAQLFKDDIRTFEFSGDEPVGSFIAGKGVVKTLTRDFMSILFPISTYTAGAAHPNNYSVVFNYSAPLRRVVTLADLFKPGSNYLKRLSEIAVADLKKQFGADAMEEWITSGAAPTAENYRSVYFDEKKNALVVLFDPYQVASYAAGGREVVIGYSELKDILSGAQPLPASGLGSGTSN